MTFAYCVVCKNLQHIGFSRIVGINFHNLSDLEKFAKAATGLSLRPAGLH